MNKNRRLFLKGVLGSSATGMLLSSSGLVQAAMHLNKMRVWLIKHPLYYLQMM